MSDSALTETPISPATVGGLSRLACANVILASLSETERRALLANATLDHFQQGERIYRQGDPDPDVDVLFPVRGLLCGTDAGADGVPLVTAFRGREGAYGVLNAASHSQPGGCMQEVVAELDCDAVRVPLADFAERLARSGALARIALEYAALLLGLSEHHAACARHHRLEGRTAYWLLLLRAHAGSDQIRVTHERVAEVLGVHRPSVSSILSDFEAHGLLQRGRGCVTIADVAGLYANACECRSDVISVEEIHRGGRFILGG
jgi:CRP-like cAMP-binding protein